MILSNILIANMFKTNRHLTPFIPEKEIAFGLSRGLSNSSYDICLAKGVWVWPLWGRLTSSRERLQMPRNVCAFVIDKSTNLRRFLRTGGFIDRGFNGHITLELTRHRPWPIYLPKGYPIAQLVFFWVDGVQDEGYSGKYQEQEVSPQRAIFEQLV
jgi:dCTP deaminase